MQSILVIGGLGFMGSNFVRYLIKNTDHRVIVYDKHTYAGRLENVKDLLEKYPNRIKVIRGDVCNEELLEFIIREYNPDIIINFVAETHVDRSINEPAPFVKTNILGIFSLLETCRRLEVPLLIHISTDEVYGDLSWTKDEASEDWPLNPSSPYSATKASADLLIKAYGRTYGLKYIIVRPCNNYGPYQHPEKLIPRTIIRLLLGKKATIYGDGMQIRDWIYVEDFCEALYTIMNKGKICEIYNVAAHQYATVKDVVYKIVELMGKDPERDIIHVRERPGEDRRYAMKIDKILQLGWRPVTTLEEGLKRTVRWYLENKWWWEPLINDRYVIEDEPWINI
ncbi:MAG: dTDP-glucose 4,6-dehydratase [Crenarchaeota archaeon]|nr:dTDP-glucose 4,6-dehydratase [Thermoproteota archaeon]